MSLASLFNKNCSWRRKTVTGRDEFGEPTHTETLITSDQPCAFQQRTRSAEENDPVNANMKDYNLFLDPDQDIEPEDILVFEGSDNYTVRDVEDAANRDHHLEVWVQQVRDL